MTIPDAAPQRPENLEVGHERRDVKIRPVLLLGLGLIALVLVALAGVWALDVGYRAVQEDALVLPTLASPVERLPPPPRLQAEPAEELAAYLAEQREELETYGWVGGEGGAVRLPIERAKELLLDRGLPMRGELPGAGQAETP